MQARTKRSNTTGIRTKKEMRSILVEDFPFHLQNNGRDLCPSLDLQRTQSAPFLCASASKRREEMREVTPILLQAKWKYSYLNFFVYSKKWEYKLIEIFQNANFSTSRISYLQWKGEHDIEVTSRRTSRKWISSQSTSLSVLRYQKFQKLENITQIS